MPTIKVASVSDNCVRLIEEFECSSNVDKFLLAYKCPAGVWTIGIGTTIYPNGSRVREGDLITRLQAYDFLKHDMRTTQQVVDSYTCDEVSQCQFDALVSFAYNLGNSALKGSTLLKKVNMNPNDPSIQGEFDKWVFAKGKKLEGLVKRRKAEGFLYFHGRNQFV